MIKKLVIHGIIENRNLREVIEILNEHVLFTDTEFNGKKSNLDDIHDLKISENINLFTDKKEMWIHLGRNKRGLLFVQIQATISFYTQILDIFKLVEGRVRRINFFGLSYPKGSIDYIKLYAYDWYQLIDEENRHVYSLPDTFYLNLPIYKSIKKDDGAIELQLTNELLDDTNPEHIEIMNRVHKYILDYIEKENIEVNYNGWRYKE